MFEEVLVTPISFPIGFELALVSLATGMKKTITEAVVQRCPVKTMFLEILQNLQESTCTRVSFLLMLQA